MACALSISSTLIPTYVAVMASLSEGRTDFAASLSEDWTAFAAPLSEGRTEFAAPLSEDWTDFVASLSEGWPDFAALRLSCSHQMDVRRSASSIWIAAIRDLIAFNRSLSFSPNPAAILAHVYART